MEEIILKLCTDMSVERIPFPQGKTPEVFDGLIGLIGNGSTAFDDYKMDHLSGLAKQEVVLLTDFFPERKAGYNQIASFLLAGTSGKEKRMPIWGNALLVKRTYTDPSDRFHFSLSGFSGISLDVLEMYILAAKKQILSGSVVDAGRTEAGEIFQAEAAKVQNACRAGRIRR